MADCAADAVSVMDAVGWDTARVLGISFGGMVAQELAVTVPGRVERLALLCTSAGGAGRSSYPLQELDSLAPDERTALGHRLLDTRFDAAWLASHPSDRALAELMDHREGAGDPGRRTAELEQLDARSHHDVWDRLDRITCPTFVGSGRFDGIAPPANGAALASQIPGAVFREYDGGHAFFVQDTTSLPEVTEFLRGPVPGAGPADR
jgi:3-oxoadipate enol-lactonase